MVSPAIIDLPGAALSHAASFLSKPSRALFAVAVVEGGGQVVSSATNDVVSAIIGTGLPSNRHRRLSFSLGGRLGVEIAEDGLGFCRVYKKVDPDSPLEVGDHIISCAGEELTREGGRDEWDRIVKETSHLPIRKILVARPEGQRQKVDKRAEHVRGWVLLRGGRTVESGDLHRKNGPPMFALLANNIPGKF